mgnify:CR=1 FL=1
MKRMIAAALLLLLGAARARGAPADHGADRAVPAPLAEHKCAGTPTDGCQATSPATISQSSGEDGCSDSVTGLLPV